MNLYKKFLTILIFSLFFVVPIKIHASENFHTTLTSTYTIQENGETVVKKEFHIRNLKSTIYLKKYGIELDSNRISQIKVFDTEGEITANVTHTDTKTTIGMEFNDNTSTVGRDKVRSFTVEYLDPDTMIYEGSILEIHVPKLLKPEEFDDYTVRLNIPEIFNLPTLSTPAEFELLTDGSQKYLKYSGENIKSGISVLFGSQQHYKFSLSYDLDNPSQSQGTLQIALPPDTQYQQVSYDTIDPQPQMIDVDDDGNWIATYNLENKDIQNIVAKGTVTVFLQPQSEIPLTLPSKKLTQTDQFWESDSEEIKNLAKQYTTPKEIFDYVVQHLHYNYARLDSKNTRLGSVQALQTPDNAVCQEFTDVFVSMARANRIPARQIIGYALTNNPQIRPLSLVRDILHAWPEYFDTKTSTWKPVDPTWSNTTGGVDYFSQLDFNHIAFVIQGQSSQKPYPPGSHSTTSENTKSVEVFVTKDVPSIPFSSDVQVIAPSSSPFGLNNKHIVSIKNNSGRAWYNIPIHFSANEEISLSQNVFVIEHLLPFQTITIPVSIMDTNGTSSHEEVVLISVEGQTTKHTVLAGSRWSRWYSALSNPLTLIVIGSASTAIVTITGIIVIQGKGKKKK